MSYSISLNPMLFKNIAHVGSFHFHFHLRIWRIWKIWKSGLQCPARVSILENFFEISLLDLDLESFLFHFHFSISISSHFHFIFISRKEWKGQKFHPFSREKEWNFKPSIMKNLTILGSRVKNPKQIMSGIMNGDTQLFIQDTTTNNSRFRFLLPILKVLHKKIKCFWGLCPVGKSDKH